MPNKVTDTYQKFRLSFITALFYSGFQNLVLLMTQRIQFSIPDSFNVL